MDEKMPRRDPKTGKFVAGDEYDDVEVVSFSGSVGVQAADLNGGTGFSGETNSFDGVKLVDYDDLVDRNEELQLVQGSHLVTVYQNSTSTADGTVAAGVGISASPTRKSVEAATASADSHEGSIVARFYTDDSIDLIGRPMEAVSYAPFSDGATGVGGAGGIGRDEVEIHDQPGELGRFHPRDELFFNGRIKSWNIDDAGVHVSVKGQHVYGVVSD